MPVSCTSSAVAMWFTAYRSFGKPGSPYDFDSVDIRTLSGHADELEVRQRGSKKKVNHKVMNMIET